MSADAGVCFKCRVAGPLAPHSNHCQACYEQWMRDHNLPVDAGYALYSLSEDDEAETRTGTLKILRGGK